MIDDEDDEYSPGGVRHDDPDTSHKAAEENFAALERSIHTQMLTADGWTTTELSRDLDVHFCSISPRMVKLEEKGLIWRTLRRRKSLLSNKGQIVWTAFYHIMEQYNAVERQRRLLKDQKGQHAEPPAPVGLGS